MIDFLALSGWWGIFSVFVISLTFYAFLRMLLLARRQELGEREELPLLHCTPGSYAARDLPTRAVGNLNPQNLTRAGKTVSTQVLPRILAYDREPTALGRPRRVLLVEDNEVNRDLAKQLLSDLGVHVTIALNGRACIERVNAERFDLVMMDLQMPLMDGLMATKAIRADGRFSGLPIVALTGRSLSGDRERSLSAGMNDHLTKPIRPETLSDMLIRWLPASTPCRPPLDSSNTTIHATGEKLPASLPPFNIQIALARANGKPELLQRMMLRFRELYAQAGTEMRKMIANEKIEEAHRLAHSLKGVAATLEAERVAVCAAAIEYALRDGQMHTVPALIQALEVALAPAIAAAATLERLNVTSSSPERPAASPPIASIRNGPATLKNDRESRYSQVHSW